MSTTPSKSDDSGQTMPMPPQMMPDLSDTASLSGESKPETNSPNQPPSDFAFPEDSKTLDEQPIEVLAVIDASGQLTTRGRSNDELGDVPGYDLITELGRGGMGVVYKAMELRLKRIVALKMIVAGTHAGSQELVRFQVEAEVIANLEHPNIIKVHQVGEHDQRPFISLEFCPDGSLDSELRRNGVLNSQEAAGLIELLARAIHTAHEKGIVHRDLKPANILLKFDSSKGSSEDYSATKSHGQCFLHGKSCMPKITDFGLAKNIVVPTGATHSGAIMGTPSYMAPEQASGKIHEIKPPTDVYALGAILYECLTGRPPFSGATPLETVRMVTEQQPAPPRVLNRNIDDDLEKITLKCLEKDPDQRYSTVLELAEDLRRYQAGEPIKARSVNFFERIQRELAFSQHDMFLRPWGNALIGLAMIMFVGYFSTSMMLAMETSPGPAFWIPRILMVGFAIPVIARSRPNGVWMPTNAVERVIWAVWIGYIISYLFVIWVMQIQGHPHLDIYGVASILSGLCWFVMGGYVWGGCYLFGWLFLFASPILASQKDWIWGPLLFGTLWTITLVTLGIRFRQMGSKSGNPSNSSGASNLFGKSHFR